MEVRKVELSEILAEASDLGSRHWQPLLIATFGIIAGYSLLDWLSFQMEDASGMAVGAMIVGSVIWIYAQYVVTERLLADRRPVDREGGTRRYGTLWVALLLIGVAIGFGAVLLIIPGIYLAGRWLTVAPHLIEGNLGATDAMQASWDASYPSQLTFFMTAILGFLPAIPGIVLSFSPAALAPGVEAMPMLVAASAFSATSTVLGWLLAAAAYRKAVPATAQFESVFA